MHVSLRICMRRVIVVDSNLDQASTDYEYTDHLPSTFIFGIPIPECQSCPILESAQLQTRISPWNSDAVLPDHCNLLQYLGLHHV